MGEVKDFGWALAQIKKGYRIRRAGWNGKGMWLALQVPDARSKMGLPYVYMKTVDGPFVPWLCSQTDMLAEDWDFFDPGVGQAVGQPTQEQSVKQPGLDEQAATCLPLVLTPDEFAWIGVTIIIAELTGRRAPTSLVDKLNAAATADMVRKQPARNAPV